MTNGRTAGDSWSPELDTLPSAEVVDGRIGDVAPTELGA
jgi:hypothetical protein